MARRTEIELAFVGKTRSHSRIESRIRGRKDATPNSKRRHTPRVVKRRRMRAKREGADSTRRAGPLYRNARAAAGVRHPPPVRHVCAPSLRPGLRASVGSQRAHHKYARGSCRPLRPCDQNAACRLACSISCLATWTSSATANRGRGGQRCGRRRDQRSSAATTLVF